MPALGPVLLVGDVIEVVFVTQSTDQAGLNIVHWKVAAAGTAPANTLGHFNDALALLNAATAYRDLIGTGARYRGRTMRVVAPTLGIAYQDTGGAGDGLAAGDMLPRQVAGMIKKVAGEAGRRKNGRMYVPFPTEDDNDAASFPTVNYIARLDVLATIVRATISFGGTGSATPVIYTRPLPNRIPPRVYSTRPMAGSVAIKKWATQRRRGSYGRVNVPII